MDRKSIIILGVAVLLLLGLSPIVDHLFPPKPSPAGFTTLTNAPPRNTPAAAASAPAPAEPAPAPATPLVLPSGPEETLTLTNEDLIFHFTSHGGGLKWISLRNYPAIISRTRDTFTETNMAALNGKAPGPGCDGRKNPVQRIAGGKAV
jgi:hypothetical protein